MLHRLAFASFPDAAAETWFAALGDTLEADGAVGLLLANLTVSDYQPLPAVVVLPGRVVVVRPATAATGLPALRPQQAALADWLGTWSELPPVPAAAIAGFAVASEPPAAAALAAGWPLTTLPQLPQRLRELPATLPLPAAILHRWAESLTDEPDDAELGPEPTGFWEQRARQLWAWLGAADVPADPPYGSAAPPDAAAEQRRLEQLRQQVFAEVQQQRQAMESREAAREQSIAQLRQQLAATPSATAEVAALQARLATETQEKNELAAAIAASRQETEVRNQELEARMRQLGQQVAQLQTRPGAAPAARHRASPKPAPGRRPAPGAWRLQWPRVALVLLALGLGGVGAVAVQRYSERLSGSPPEPPPRRERRAAAATDENLEAAAPTLFDIQPDTIRVEADDTDDAASSELLTPPPGEVMDSVVAPQEGI